MKGFQNTMKNLQALFLVITILKHVYAEQEVCVRRCNGFALTNPRTTALRDINNSCPIHGGSFLGQSALRNRLPAQVSSDSQSIQRFRQPGRLLRYRQILGAANGRFFPIQKRSALISEIEEFFNSACGPFKKYNTSAFVQTSPVPFRCDVIAEHVTCIIPKYRCHCNQKRLAMEAVTGVELDITDGYEYKTTLQARLTNGTLTELEPDTYSGQTCRFGIYCNIFETHLLDASMVNATHVSFNFHLNVVRRRINEEISETVDTGDIGGFYMTVFYGLVDACTHGSC